MTREQSGPGGACMSRHHNLFLTIILLNLQLSRKKSVNSRMRHRSSANRSFWIDRHRPERYDHSVCKYLNWGVPALKKPDDVIALEEMAKRDPGHWEAAKTPIALPPGGQLDGGPLYYIYGYKNYSPQDRHCGQAAMATILQHWQICPPFATPGTITDKDLPGRTMWDDGYIIDRISQQPNMGPDVIGGVLGTSPYRMESSLRSLGLNVKWSWGPQTNYDSILPFLRQGIPVATLINCNDIWGKAGAHWVVVFKLEQGKVYFTNPIGSNRFDAVDYGIFDRAWGWWTGFTKCHVVAWK